jgi:hypothetical protein
MRRPSVYPSGTSRGRWFIMLLGTVLATLVLARVLNLIAERDASVQAVRSAPPPSRLTPSSTKAVREGARPARPIPLVMASGAPANTDEPLEAEPSAQDYIDSVRAEPRDDAWAGPTEQLFEEDLREKAQQHDFRVGAVVCHTNSCEAELYWNSLREARADFKAALDEPERSRCQPRLILTDGGHEDAPEMGVMLLHCKAQRQRAARRAGVAPVQGEEEEM